jgi:urease accessory protein
MKTAVRTCTIAATFAALPTLALAHPGHGDDSSLIAGALHPFEATDHVFALLAVGLLGWRMGGRLAWLLPAGFLVLLALGLGAGFAGLQLPRISPLAFVALATCALLAFRPLRRLSGIIVALAVMFAFAHGAAHGEWSVAGPGGWLFAAGFLAASALIMGAGSAAALLVSRRAAQSPGR